MISGYNDTDNTNQFAYSYRRICTNVNSLTEMRLTAYNSRILYMEAIPCHRRVRLERHKQGICVGNDFPRQCGTAVSAQLCRRVIHPVVHCDFVIRTGAALLNVQREELQFNYLQRIRFSMSNNCVCQNDLLHSTWNMRKSNNIYLSAKEHVVV